MDSQTLRDKYIFFNYRTIGDVYALLEGLQYIDIDPSNTIAYNYDGSDTPNANKSRKVTVAKAQITRMGFDFVLHGQKLDEERQKGRQERNKVWSERFINAVISIGAAVITVILSNNDSSSKSDVGPTSISKKDTIVRIDTVVIHDTILDQRPKKKKPRVISGLNDHGKLSLIIK